MMMMMNYDTVSPHNTDADFEAILGQLNSLDQLFDSVAADISPAAATTGPTPPRSAGHQAPATSAPRSDFDGCEDVLRGALLQLNTIAHSPAADSAVNGGPASPGQNGDVGQRRSCGTEDDRASSSSSSSLATIASDKSSSLRNGGSSSPSVSSPSLVIKPAQVFLFLSLSG